MPILKKQIKSDFTTVHNAFARDPNLGIAARGLLFTMLSMSDDWNFSIKGLAKILPDGECKVATALKELEKGGYLRRTRIYENGKVREWEYLFADEPVFTSTVQISEEKQELENLELENLDVGIQNVDFLNLENRHDNKISNNQISNNQSINQSIDEIDEIDMTTTTSFQDYEAEIKQNIDYDALSESYRNGDGCFSGDIDKLNELVELMTECCISSEPTVRIGKQNIPREVVKSRFLKLNSEHISYVFSSLDKTTTKIKNVKAYLLTALFNSFTTLSNGTAAELRQCMPQFANK